MSSTEIGFTIDTGHLLLAGIEPTTALASYPDRVNHIHIKDVRCAGVPGPEVTHACDLDDWWGDVDIASFIERLIGAEHRWLVIEQDRDPAPAGSLDGISRDELANRRWLEGTIATGSSVRTADLANPTNKGEGL